MTDSRWPQGDQDGLLRDLRLAHEKRERELAQRVRRLGESRPITPPRARTGGGVGGGIDGGGGTLSRATTPSRARSGDGGGVIDGGDSTGEEPSAPATPAPAPPQSPGVDAGASLLSFGAATRGAASPGPPLRSTSAATAAAAAAATATFQTASTMPLKRFAMSPTHGVSLAARPQLSAGASVAVPLTLRGGRGAERMSPSRGGVVDGSGGGGGSSAERVRHLLRDLQVSKPCHPCCLILQKLKNTVLDDAHLSLSIN